MSLETSENPSPSVSTGRNGAATLWLAAGAAFCTYFCMYAFRKPFTAATFEGQELWGFSLKSTLVISQLLGYMLSKFIGIKVVSELPARYRAVGILALIGTAELALIGYATLPMAAKPFLMFLNGLPLGMVFGLVLAYLEGRRQTEALSAALCASFIISSGVVKSIGVWLLDLGVSPFVMPAAVGGMFAIPLLVSVAILQATPGPDEEDRRVRSERPPMTSAQRRDFLFTFFPGLALLLLVYTVLTILRTFRDDFAVEIWSGLGVSEEPSVFATSETFVAVIVVLLNGLMIWVSSNRQALRLTVTLMTAAFGIAWLSGFLPSIQASPLGFMVLCGVALYIPYVAFHTSIFERLVASAGKPANLGFLMYWADAVGYLGYAAIILSKKQLQDYVGLSLFRSALLWGAAVSFVALVLALIYFERVLPQEEPDGEAPELETK